MCPGCVSRECNDSQGLLTTRDELINYVLDLKCSEESVRMCCSLVKSIYEARVKLSEECEG